MSLNAISSGTMGSQISQMAVHKIPSHVKLAKPAAVNSRQQTITTAQSREEANESASQRAIEAGSEHNTGTQRRSINLFA